MSEIDRIFPRREERGTQTPSSEKRLIVPRRGGKARAVEVVHVRRSRLTEKHSRPAPWSVHAETWLNGFRAKSAPVLPQRDMQPVTPEPAQPVAHVMPMWQPSPQQPVQPVTKPAEPPVETATVERPKPRTSKPHAPKATVRHFADPFADDEGANCIRCGYLVEPAREKRGLMTCSQCG